MVVKKVENSEFFRQYISKLVGVQFNEGAQRGVPQMSDTEKSYFYHYVMKDGTILSLGIMKETKNIFAIQVESAKRDNKDVARLLHNIINAPLLQDECMALNRDLTKCEKRINQLESEHVRADSVVHANATLASNAQFGVNLLKEIILKAIKQ